MSIFSKMESQLAILSELMEGLAGPDVKGNKFCQIPACHEPVGCPTNITRCTTCIQVHGAMLVHIADGIHGHSRKVSFCPGEQLIWTHGCIFKELCRQSRPQFDVGAGVLIKVLRVGIQALLIHHNERGKNSDRQA